MCSNRARTTPSTFLTTYDARMGIKVFDEEDRCILKLLAQLMNLFLWPFLSSRCFHQWGGAKMMLREAHDWINPGAFVYKTDAYSYYASLNHGHLVEQIKAIRWPPSLLDTVIAYCKRTILCTSASVHCQQGIPKGGNLSPVLGALYLTPLDHAMERWMARSACFYARFQDDTIIASRKRYVLRRMRKAMFKILDELRLSLRPEKTFVGRRERGFDLLGYHITIKGMTPNLTTQKRAFEKADRRYAQGGVQSLQVYLKRWRNWVHADLPFKVDRVEDIIQYIFDTTLSSQSYSNSQRATQRPTSLCMARGKNILKGKSTCIENFFRHLNH